jgi:predicted nucleotidyltransferase
MKFGIPDESLDKLLGTISRETRVEGIVLYGSRAKGTFRSGSDIDLCLDASELDYSTLMRIENELDDLLLPWKIDLAIRQRIDNAELLSHIERVGKTLFRRGAE